MIHRFRRTTYSIALTAAAVAAPIAAPPLTAQSPAVGVTLIDDVTVIDGTGRSPMESRSVLVVDGRIAEVAAAGTIELPDGATHLNGRGRWLTPGLIDTHAHLSLGPVEIGAQDGLPTMNMAADPDVPLRTLRTLLAHGVTSARDPGGEPTQLVALREAVSTGVLIGPRLKVAGLVIDRSRVPGLVETVSTPEEVRAAVRAHAAAGVDMIKLYTALTPDLVQAGIDEARALGIQSVAHLMMTSWTDAAEMGLDQALHIIPGSPDLLAEARRPDLFRAMQRGTQFMYAWFELVDLDGPEIEAMIEAMVRNDVSVDPTLVLFEGMVRGDDPYYTEAGSLELASPSLVDNWKTQFNFNGGWSDVDYTEARAAWPTFLELARRLHEGGVLLTAGTDANNPWIVPGVSLHRELELLVDAGIPELDVLTIATRNGARVMGIDDEVGTIEVGKWADLVLLNADPLADISNVRQVVWVMQAGRRYEPQSLLARMPVAEATR